MKIATLGTFIALFLGAVATDEPSLQPSADPTDVSKEPSVEPTDEPTDGPTNEPTDGPTNGPSLLPSLVPTKNNCIIYDVNPDLPELCFPFTDGGECGNGNPEFSAVCDLSIGPSACVVCPVCEYEILDHSCLTQNFAAQGDVCGNEGKEDEAYCNYFFGDNACVIGCRVENYYDNDDWRYEDDWFIDDGENAVEGRFCFSSNMEVIVQGKGLVTMASLRVGDFVKIGNGNVYEQVYAFGHRVSERYSEFVQLHTNVGTPLEMTGEHLVFVDGKPNPVRADSIKIGDVLQAGESIAVVQRIKLVTRNGVYNPLTSSGTIQVNGITASNYISFQKENNEFVELQGGIEIPISHHDFAHLAIAPFRFYCTYVAICNMIDGDSGMPVYMSKGMKLVEWRKKQHIAVQLFVWSSLLMFILAVISMTCAFLAVPAYMISGSNLPAATFTFLYIDM